MSNEGVGGIDPVGDGEDGGSFEGEIIDVEGGATLAEIDDGVTEDGEIIDTLVGVAEEEGGAGVESDVGPVGDLIVAGEDDLGVGDIDQAAVDRVATVFVEDEGAAGDIDGAEVVGASAAEGGGAGAGLGVGAVADVGVEAGLAAPADDDRGGVDLRTGEGAIAGAGEGDGAGAVDALGEVDVAGTGELEVAGAGIDRAGEREGARVAGDGGVGGDGEGGVEGVVAREVAQGSRAADAVATKGKLLLGDGDISLEGEGGTGSDGVAVGGIAERFIVSEDDGAGAEREGAAEAAIVSGKGERVSSGFSKGDPVGGDGPGDDDVAGGGVLGLGTGKCEGVIDGLGGGGVVGDAAVAQCEAEAVGGAEGEGAGAGLECEGALGARSVQIRCQTDAAGEDDVGGPVGGGDRVGRPIDGIIPKIVRATAVPGGLGTERGDVGQEAKRPRQITPAGKSC